MRNASARSRNLIPLSWGSKDADEVLTHSIDFAERLGPCDSISSATFSLTTAAGLVIDDSEHDGCHTASVTLSGGTAGGKAKVLCRIVSADGLTLDETVSLIIKAR